MDIDEEYVYRHDLKLPRERGDIAMRNVSRAVLPAAIAVFLAATIAPALALDEGDILVRVRGIWVDPIDSSSGVSPDLPTARIGVVSAPTAELDLSYMFTENIGAELILAVPVHDLQGEGTISALGKIGDAYLLPPVLALQYHFMPKNWIRPYVGIGVNYTIFFDESSTASLDTALGGHTSIDIDNSFGVAGQAGVDIDVAKDIFVNFDVKFVNIAPDVTLTTGNTVRRAQVDINPLIIGVGVGTRF
jgi:outer membrane protein